MDEKARDVVPDRVDFDVPRILGSLRQARAAINVALDDVQQTMGGEPAERESSDLDRLKRFQRAQRARDRHFQAGLFEDPAWDMMMALYAAHLEGRRMSISALCIAANSAATTALRWINKLTEEGLLVRVADPADRRRAFIERSADARRRLRSYLHNPDFTALFSPDP